MSYIHSWVGGQRKVSWGKQLTACELEIMELSDYEKLTTVFLKGQVTEPLEDQWHLLCASVVRKRKKKLPVKGPNRNRAIIEYIKRTVFCVSP